MPNALEEVAEKAASALKAGQAAFQGLTGVWKKLVQEHGEVATMLKRIAMSSDPEVRARLYPEVRRQLLAHERCELTDVYPILSSYEMTRRIALAHEDKAREIEAAIVAVDKLEFASPEWPRSFELLVQTVEQHVNDEEGDYFPRAQDVLGEEESKAMLERYEAAKREELERLTQS